jgi:predicted nucleic acid-binding protein
LAIEQLRQFLRRYRQIALDASIFIYQLENNTKYIELTDFVFAWVERPGHAAVTSTITMMELLVPAYREEDERQVDTFYGLLSTYPNLQWMPPDLETADLAAQLRARYGLQTPDALQAATALRAGASAFITNDPVFRKIEEFEAAVMDHYL